MRNTLAGIMVAVAGAALAAAPAQADIKVGIIASATGPGASLGQPQMKSVQLLPTTIGGEKVTYVALDDESDGSKSALAARKLLSDDKVDVIIGSSLTPTSLPLIDIAFETKTPMVSMAASHVLVLPMDEKRRWVFKVVPNDAIMVNAIAKYMAKVGAKKIGYIGVSDGYGEGNYNALVQVAPKYGLEVTTHEVYARSDSSVTGQVLKVLASKPDAVFIASAGTPAVLPQKALRERGYTGPIYQTHGIATQEFITLGGKDVEGAIFSGEVFTIAGELPDSDPFKKAPAEFVKRYQAAHGQPPSIFGAHLFDAMTLVERAIPGALKVAKPGTAEFRSALRDEIEKTNGVYLNNGQSTMSPGDHNGYDERSTFIIKIENGAFRQVK